MTTDSTVAIAAIGMTTPVGLTAQQSCAAVRAGISAMAELDFTIVNEEFDEVPVIGCAIPPVTDGYAGLGRWTRLATAALRDMIEQSGLSGAQLDSAALYLALPPLGREGFDARIGERLGVRVASVLELDGLAHRTFVYPFGHAAGARACQDAIAQVAAGTIERAIVCGVDSLLEPDTLEFFLGKRRLKTGDVVDGFVPGEAAACMLFERRGRLEARGARAVSIIEAANVAIEPISIWSADPSPSTGLTDAIRGTFAQVGDVWHDTKLVVCDLNGETYRSKEYGTVAARVLSVIPNSYALWHPADCIGDTGAASFVVSMCVAARALGRGYAKSNRALIFGSSDDGLRGAVSLTRAMEA